jgi:hypothetical protein
MAVGFGEARAERLTHNQALFRDINERVDELLGRTPATAAREEFLCECASDACVEHITITPEQYRQVRASPVTFAVVADEAHVFADIEEVVARHEGYWIVEKQGEAAEVARAESERERRRNDGGGGD